MSNPVARMRLANAGRPEEEHHALVLQQPPVANVGHHRAIERGLEVEVGASRGLVAHSVAIPERPDEGLSKSPLACRVALATRPDLTLHSLGGRLSAVMSNCSYVKQRSDSGLREWP